MRRRNQERRDEQSIEAVKPYHQQGLSQVEVAARMVCRAPRSPNSFAYGARARLCDHRSTIRARTPGDASALGEGFGLASVCVAGRDMTEGEAIAVGRVGADVVTQLVRDGMSVGIPGAHDECARAHCPGRPSRGRTRRPAQGRDVVF